MSVSEPEWAKPIHGERRMAIMNAVYDIMSVSKKNAFMRSAKDEWLNKATKTVDDE